VESCECILKLERKIKTIVPVNIQVQIRNKNHESQPCPGCADTLHFLKITPNKTTLSIIIKSGGILLF
jgi:hypothetical protein